MAALLRFVCFPSSSSIFSSSNQQQFFINPINPNPSSSLQSLSLSVSLPNRRPQRPNLLIFPTQSAVESPPVDNPTQQSGEEEEEEEDEGSRTRLLAQNVPWTCTADDIRPLFEKYGTVVDIEISMYSKTRNRGLVFVSMGSHEEALAAFTNLQSYEFMGRTLNLTWAKPKKTKEASSPAQPKPAPIHNLFVANLSFRARSKDLVEFFNAENSNAVSAEIIFNQNPRGSAGYGFVSFNTKQEADAALSAFQGKMFMGRPIRVAPSKKFLRQSTKKVLESKDESSKSESDGGEQAQTTEVEA
ncbi:putative RNA recognition motif domain, nucleotide-binding alpha-beta plait domain superfamily [Helianthus annuus]|nr:putative RNA recognition motif domain, nucleotide-binding alpha-beta plait domain superfamily [Helianthus annuus]KAJ0579099.1 putative RNA recognition motif domain, nucleotide-binding alpha-beta plait domain superfamily [Helianthus annuus]KAJ0586227.1 putative RNA recognition motif domain, nucleotide-binding alpha-beta plait domain superfamily [Helianthus annuus]KAJ0748711.1 putative RNA recognition motif domain, nucleotide-binding alpha-beta plait domain superfamily [Helianthus annuus]KAJ09